MNLINLALRLKATNNPVGVLQEIGGNDPVIQRAIEMIQGKSPTEIMQVAQNLARTRGMDLESLKQNILGNIM